MPILIRFADGPRAGNVLPFDDSVDKIVIGRDPARCQVLFPPDETRVGREHCALQRKLGRYEVEVNRDDVVQLNGERVRVLTELPAECTLQIGAGGPLLILQSSLTALPSTRGKNRQDGIGTILKRTSEETRRNRVVAWSSLVALALVAAGLVTWIRLNDPQRRLVQAVRAATPSVYLVLIRQGEVETPKGTSWVIDQAGGLLATNAHVAQLFEQREPGAQMLVRSPGPNPKTFVVDEVRKHPGYEAFDKQWQEFDPVRPSEGGTFEKIPYSAVGCDVALLHVAKPTGLAPQLRLADDKALYEMQPGERVGDVGFPTEGQSQGGVAIDSPVPVPNFDGEIRQVTDYFRADNVPPEERLFIGHSFPTAGGASGSPILNRQGEVVAIHCAGNPISIGEASQGVRINSAVISFAQRSDLLSELLNGTVAQQMAARRKQWGDGLARHYKRRTALVSASLFKGRVQDLVGRFERLLAPTFEFEAKAEAISTLTDLTLDKVSESRPAKWRRQIQLPSAGTYLLAAIADEDKPVRLTVGELADGHSKPIRQGESAEGTRNVQYTVLELSSPKTVEVSVTSAAEGGDVRLAVLRGHRSRRSNDQLHQALRQEWIAGINSHGGPFRSKEWTRASGSLPPPSSPGAASTKPFEFASLPVGKYLVSLVTSHGEQITLSAASSTEPLSEAAGCPGSCLSSAFALAASGTIRGVLTSKRADNAEYELRLYQAVAIH
jgi:hypothetical protein